MASTQLIGNVEEEKVDQPLVLRRTSLGGGKGERRNKSGEGKWYSREKVHRRRTNVPAVAHAVE